jgi:hypothetical protein
LVHYLNRGWAIHNTISNAWEISSKYATLPIMAKNLLVLGLRLFEYGRIFMVPIFLFMLLNLKKIKTNKNLKMIILCAFTQALFILPIVVIYQNSFSTRYFLPLLILMLFGTLYYITTYWRKPISILVFFFVLQFGGYFIVYPQKTAMPWDSTPAHWPYYSLREKMFQYIETEKIGFDNISADFNLYGYQRIKDLKREYTITQDPIKKYYIHTNISNATDDLINDLGNNKKWVLIKRFQKRGVFIELYKKQYINR